MRSFRWYHVHRILAIGVLLEQMIEAATGTVSLAQNPTLVIAALAVFGLPVPQAKADQ